MNFRSLSNVDDLTKLLTVDVYLEFPTRKMFNHYVLDSSELVEIQTALVVFIVDENLKETANAHGNS